MNRSPVRPKKHLGQHFLIDGSVSRRIADAINLHHHEGLVLEIGPGTGMLTKYLLAREDIDLLVCEIDRESIAYLNQHFGELEDRIIDKDFLKLDLEELSEDPFAVVGNFPYNISSQILFKILENRNLVPEMVGMFQKEVAARIASPPGSKVYGILSVLLKAFYDLEYLFTVDASAFDPPPKVQSGVVRMLRNDVDRLECDEDLFIKVVKTAFNQRRKTLRNSLRGMWTDRGLKAEEKIWSERPEQLGVAEFVELTLMLEKAS